MRKPTDGSARPAAGQRSCGREEHGNHVQIDLTNRG